MLALDRLNEICCMQPKQLKYELVQTEFQGQMKRSREQLSVVCQLDKPIGSCAVIHGQ